MFKYFRMTCWYSKIKCVCAICIYPYQVDMHTVCSSICELNALHFLYTPTKQQALFTALENGVVGKHTLLCLRSLSSCVLEMQSAAAR